MTPFQTLKQMRATYLAPMSPDQNGMLLNGVAWVHRAEGLGMLWRPNGSHCKQPLTGTTISRDYLVCKDGPTANGS